MHVECIRELDVSEPDADGTYECDVYRFTEEGVCFVARSTPTRRTKRTSSPSSRTDSVGSSPTRT